jgi:hypothetical protein
VIDMPDTVFKTDLKAGDVINLTFPDGKVASVTMERKSGQVARLIVTSSSEAKISKQKQ